MKKTLVFTAFSALLFTAGIQAAQAQFTINVGYADTLRANSFFPDPWEGSPNVNFWGRIANTGEYDAGAIQIVNTGTTPLLLTTALVDHFTNTSVSYHIWDGQIGAGYAIPVGQSLILTQNDGTENFDTSDNGSGAPLGHDSAGHPYGDTTTPHVKLTLDGVAYDFIDSGQVLNTSGYDFAYDGSNESFAWRPIGTFGGQSGTPEPGALALLGAGSLVGTLFVRRRRKA